MKPIVIITGYGPGLGEALKQRFEQGGYQAIGIARSAGDFQADLTDPEQTDAVIKAIIKQHGTPKVVIHNVAELIRGKFLDLKASDFERAWRSTVLTAINVSQAVIPAMQDQQAGTLILTGATASIRGSACFGPFSSAKFALRGLAQSLAREFQAQGLHIVHPILDGIIWSEVSQQRFPNMKQENCLQSEDLANIYWDLTHQAPSVWTHEIDIRPQSESF
jgi:NAD(P)-dependent dehydrogenase (short-subunit alcohol dehydrogenase family)